MYLVLIFLIMVIFLLLLIFLGSLFISSKVFYEFHKASSFECGFNSMSIKRLPFSIHFFLVAVIFLIFDIEVVIIFPIIVILQFSSIYVWFYIVSFFITILIMGLYHEWYNGILNWTF
uniref:NADH-ubiquinone oxidoreductase chain 3 n=1 Tax=Dusuna sp. TaxID=3133678 RepID=A0AAU6PBZ1_9HEMI